MIRVCRAALPAFGLMDDRHVFHELSPLQKSDELVLAQAGLAQHRLRRADLTRLPASRERDDLTVGHFHIDVVTAAASAGDASGPL